MYDKSKINQHNKTEASQVALKLADLEISVNELS